MPTPINDYYEFALTAMAAYSASGEEPDLEDEGFVSSQIDSLTGKFEHLVTVPGTDTGFSGTFYRIKSGDQTGHIVYALRGTEFDFLSDPEATCV